MSDAAVKQHYIRIERYDWVMAADRFLGVESIFHRNRERVFVRLLRRHMGGSAVMDVGCGTGLILRHMNKESLGLDINPWAIRKAKQHAKRQVVQGDAEMLPIKTSTVDLVICTETLEHLPRPLLTLNEMYRILKPGGKMLGSVPHPHPGWMFRFLSSTHPHDEPFHHMYTRSQVKDILRSAGFKVEQLSLSLFALNTIFVGEKT